jgi:PAS domain-containing protein/anti-sigma regulatory factor (Ser/Thr protein kinase)
VDQDCHPDRTVPDGWDARTFVVRLSELAPIGLMVVDRELRPRWMNQTAMDMSGLSPDDLGARTLPELFPGVEPAAWKVIRHVLASGEPSLDIELGGTTPATGSDRRVWRVSDYPITDRDGATAAVGVAFVDVTEQRLAEAAREGLERRRRLIRRASRLIGTSLDLTATLEGMVDLVVPEFADHCDLYLAEEPLNLDARPAGLTLRRVVGVTSSTHLDHASGPLSWFMRVKLDRDHPAYRSFIARRPILFEVDAQHIDTVEHPDREKFFEYIAVRTAITVPLLVGHDYHGSVFFGLGVSGRTFTQDDVQTAAELGGPIANAVANAVAYDRQRVAALILQRGLLPGDLPTVEGLDLAWRYEPGGYPGRPHRDQPASHAGTEVGGDWLDVVPLSAGRVALVVGDVMGRGLTAAAVMGQVRAAVRAFAALDLPAADVITHLNDLVLTIGAGLDGTLVSCIYAVFEPATATITIANAGHLPPALVDPYGNVHFLDATDGIILGVAAQTFTEFRYPFPPGATLVLYTDGLVESPTTDIDQGTGRLRTALAEPGTLRTTADRLLTVIDHSGGYDDDVALLLVRATIPATVATQVLPPDPRAAKTARDIAVTALHGWQLAEHADLMELLVSEVVTNAIRYANTPSHLTLRRGRNALYVEIADGDSRVPRLLNPTADDEGGRGLQLVAELATHWGARPTSTGKTVWFQLDTPRTE